MWTIGWFCPASTRLAKTKCSQLFWQPTAIQGRPHPRGRTPCSSQQFAAASQSPFSHYLEQYPRGTGELWPSYFQLWPHPYFPLRQRASVPGKEPLHRSHLSPVCKWPTREVLCKLQNEHLLTNLLKNRTEWPARLQILKLGSEYVPTIL